MTQELQELAAILDNMRKFTPVHPKRTPRHATWTNPTTLSFPRGSVELDHDSNTRIWRFQNGAHVIESSQREGPTHVTLGHGTRVLLPPRAFVPRIRQALQHALHDIIQGQGDRHPGGVVVLQTSHDLVVSIVPIGTKQLRVDLVGNGPPHTKTSSKGGCLAWTGWILLILLALTISAAIIAGVIWLVRSQW